MRFELSYLSDIVEKMPKLEHLALLVDARDTSMLYETTLNAGSKALRILRFEI